MKFLNFVAPLRWAGLNNPCRRAIYRSIVRERTNGMLGLIYFWRFFG